MELLIGDFSPTPRTKMAEPTAEQSVSVVAVTAAVGAVVLLLILLCGFTRKSDDEKEEQEEEKPEAKQNGQSKQQKKSAPSKAKRVYERKEAFTHQWLCGTLKGHSAPVLDLDFSPNGKYLASAAEDRTVLIWSTKDFNKKDHKNIRCNVQYDYATKVRFSPDNKAFITSLYSANAIRIFRLGKKDDGSPGNIQAAGDFEKAHLHDILNIGIASSGRFIMTCSKDTTLKVWDIKGQTLATINSNQVTTSHAAVSPCGRFIASSGFTPDVKVWEVAFDKSGTYREVARAFELKGHTAGIYHFAFSGDSTRMATASKDSTWRVYDTNIEYDKGQEPYLLQTGKFDGSQPARISLSHDGRTVALSQGSTVYIYNALTTTLEQTLENVHAGPVTTVVFDSSDRFMATAGDKHIQIFHNVVGHRATIADLQQRKKKATQNSLRDRLQQQIDEARKALEEIEGEMQEDGKSK